MPSIFGIIAEHCGIFPLKAEEKLLCFAVFCKRFFYISSFLSSFFLSSFLSSFFIFNEIPNLLNVFKGELKKVHFKFFFAIYLKPFLVNMMCRCEEMYTNNILSLNSLFKRIKLMGKIFLIWN